MRERENEGERARERERVCVEHCCLQPSLSGSACVSWALLLVRLAARYGMALVSRIDKIISLFCKRALQTRQYSAKETYIFLYVCMNVCNSRRQDIPYSICVWMCVCVYECVCVYVCT